MERRGKKPKRAETTALGTRWLRAGSPEAAMLKEGGMRGAAAPLLPPSAGHRCTSALLIAALTEVVF